MDIPACLLCTFPPDCYPRFAYFLPKVREFERRTQVLLSKYWIEVDRRRKAKELIEQTTCPIQVLVLSTQGKSLPIPKLAQTLETEDPALDYIYINPSRVEHRTPTFVVLPYLTNIEARDQVILRGVQAFYKGIQIENLLLVDLRQTQASKSVSRASTSVIKRRRRRPRTRRRLQASRSLSFTRVTPALPAQDVLSHVQPEQTKEHTITEDKLKETIDEVFEGHSPRNIIFTDEELLSTEICNLLEKKTAEALGLLTCILTSALSNDENSIGQFVADVIEEQLQKLTAGIVSSGAYTSGWILELNRTEWTGNEALETMHKNKNHIDAFKECFICGLLFKASLTISGCHRDVIYKALVSKSSPFSKVFPEECVPEDVGALLLAPVSRAMIEICQDTRPVGNRYRIRAVPRHSIPEPRTVRMETDQEQTVIWHEKWKLRECRRYIRLIFLRHGNNIATLTSKASVEVFLELFRKSQQPWRKKVERLLYEIQANLKDMKYPQAYLESQNNVVVDEVEKQAPEKVTKYPQVYVEAQNKVVDDRLSKVLFESVRSVLGCGYYFGKLRIHVCQDAFGEHRQKIEQQICEVLSQFGITEYDVVPASSKIKLLAQPGVGSEIVTSDGRAGTLGCFVQRQVQDRVAAAAASAGKGHTHTLCALVSHHVVYGAEKVFVIREDDGQQRIEIGRSVDGKDKERNFDIAAVEIKEDLRKEFKTMFRNTEGRPYKKFKLCDFEDKDVVERLDGRSVHIWGAKSAPGRGVIQCATYILKVEKNTSKDDEVEDEISSTSGKEESLTEENWPQSSSDQKPIGAEQKTGEEEFDSESACRSRDRKHPEVQQPECGKSEGCKGEESNSRQQMSNVDAVSNQTISTVANPDETTTGASAEDNSKIVSPDSNTPLDSVKKPTDNQSEKKDKSLGRDRTLPDSGCSEGTVTSSKEEKDEGKIPEQSSSSSFYRDTYVIIADEDNGDDQDMKPFSQAGDSGSVIVMEEPGDRKTVTVLSMLIGKREGEDGEYFSFRLVDGLNSLQKRSNSTLRLIDK